MECVVVEGEVVGEKIRKYCWRDFIGGEVMEEAAVGWWKTLDVKLLK